MASSWIRSSFRMTRHITNKTRIARQGLGKRPIRSKSTSCDRTWLAIQDYTQQRFSCRHISKRSPSISETISKNNCIVRDSGRASLATAAADSSTKGLACLETVEGAVPLAKSLAVLGIDSDGTFCIVLHDIYISLSASREIKEGFYILFSIR
ncbi:hypothetical protein Gasu2_44520 [Galdieria sulphuraria]|nr:hypothetical protein Gasu2_44520 [Galdieria sulphuraria]